MSIYGVTGSNGRRTISIKDANGSVVGTISISAPSKSSSKKKKRLQYSFKQISSQIMISKTSSDARRIVTRARGKVADILRKSKNSDYDEAEVRAALAHARSMERIARKRVKHLQQEEKANKQGIASDEKMEEKMETYFAEENRESDAVLNIDDLIEIMQELQDLMEESSKELMRETGLEELTEELIEVSKGDMSEEDLENLKKKHRSDELREIMEADMKYLKAFFDKLEKEKQESSNSLSSSNNANPVSGISLELGGLEVPVEINVEPAVMEGGSVDVTV